MVQRECAAGQPFDGIGLGLGDVAISVDEALRLGRGERDDRVGYWSLLRVFGGGVSSLTRDTRGSRPGRAAGETRGRTSRTCASPGAERAGAAVRRGHHRRHADGRCGRHERSAPAGDHAVALVLRQPCHELAGWVGRGCNGTRATRTPCAVGGGEYKLLTVAGEILPTEAMHHDSLSPARFSMLSYVSGANRPTAVPQS